MKTQLILTSLAILLFAGTAQATIINGGFETGNFTGWTVSGFGPEGLMRPDIANHTTADYLASEAFATPLSSNNSVVTSQNSGFHFTVASPAVNPTQGDFLAFISNQTSAQGLGLVGSAIRQTFTVSQGARFLSFDTQFLSHEILDSDNDFGGVALLDSNNHIIHDFTLDHNPGTNVGPGNPGGGLSATNAHATANATGGFSDSTGWLTESFNLDSLAGQNVTLIGYIINTRDTGVESRLLLDNVAENFVLAPEPASIALIAVGLLGFGLLRKRQKA
jgi:hypothetical protein